MSSAAVKPTEAATKYEDSDPSAGGSISENETVTGDGQDGGSTKKNHSNTNAHGHRNDSSTLLWLRVALSVRARLA